METAALRFRECFSSGKITVSAAESCTGGLIGATITSVPGSSSFFLGSVVTYSNGAKENILHVPHGIIEKYGAVSKETAKHMSEGAVKLYGSDVAVAVTGIAGPGGATPSKPVGLVYVSVSDGSKTVTVRNMFRGTRDEIRTQTVEKALSMLTEFVGYV